MRLLSSLSKYTSRLTRCKSLIHLSNNVHNHFIMESGCTDWFDSFCLHSRFFIAWYINSIGKFDFEKYLTFYLLYECSKYLYLTQNAITIKLNEVLFNSNRLWTHNVLAQNKLFPSILLTVYGARSCVLLSGARAWANSSVNAPPTVQLYRRQNC